MFRRVEVKELLSLGEVGTGFNTTAHQSTFYFFSWSCWCISLQGHRVIESPRSACIVYSWFLLDPCRQGAGKQFRAPLSSSHGCFIECHPSFSQEWNSAFRRVAVGDSAIIGYTCCRSSIASRLPLDFWVSSMQCETRDFMASRCWDFIFCVVQGLSNEQHRIFCRHATWQPRCFFELFLWLSGGVDQMPYSSCSLLFRMRLTTLLMHSEYTIKDGALCHSSLPCAGLWRFRCLLTIRKNIHESPNFTWIHEGALDPEGPGGPSALSSTVPQEALPKKFGGFDSFGWSRMFDFSNNQT